MTAQQPAQAQPQEAMDGAMDGKAGSVASPLLAQVRQAIAQAGGWLPFSEFMALALYTPGLGYYSNGRRKFGAMPGSGSDFVTAPELSPWFGRALAAQVRQGLAASGVATVTEFGAGSGALAEQLLDTLDAQDTRAGEGPAIQRYQIIDLSGELRARQTQRLARFAPRVHWLDRLPEALDGVVLGNEVLDAMPVDLLHFDGTHWWARGVVADDTAATGLAWADRPTQARPPLDAPFLPGTVTEIHPQAEAFVRSLAAVLRRGLALFIDYGFPEHEYYHPQRHQGTLMCHRAHLADDQPLADVGQKDITAHVNFSSIALAGQEAGLDVVGYTSQARFLFNCGLAEQLVAAPLAERAMAHKLVAEHEMGELFKVIGFSRGLDAATPWLGFAAGDRTHRL